MLLDLASLEGGGESALAAAHYLNAYLSDQFRPNPPQVKIAIIKANNKMELVPYQINYIFRFEKDAPLIQSLSNSKYKKFSPFGEFNIMTHEGKSSRKLKPRFSKLKSELQALKAERSNSSAANRSPSYKLIEQSGTLDFTWAEIKALGILHWLDSYVLQLKYYRGPDQADRFNAVYDDPQGRQLLINYWDRFTLLPDAQAKIFAHISPSKTPDVMEYLIKGFARVSPSLGASVVEQLLAEADDSLKKRIEETIPGRAFDNFPSIYFQLAAKPGFKQSAENMLDNFLMPEILITEEGIEPHIEQIKERFGDLMDYQLPETLVFAKQKYEAYLNQKTWLPRMLRRSFIPIAGTENISTPLLPAEYKTLRAQIFGEIRQVIDDAIKEDDFDTQQ